MNICFYLNTSLSVVYYYYLSFLSLSFLLYKADRQNKGAIETTLNTQHVSYLASLRSLFFLPLALRSSTLYPGLPSANSFAFN